MFQQQIDTLKLINHCRVCTCTRTHTKFVLLQASQNIGTVTYLLLVLTPVYVRYTETDANDTENVKWLFSNSP